MYAILLIVLFVLIAWYFFWYVVRELYINHIYKKYSNNVENDYSDTPEELFYTVYVVKELPKPSDDTMEKLYIAIDEKNTTQVWVTLHHPEKHVYAWCPVSNAYFCDELSDLIF